MRIVQMVDALDYGDGVSNDIINLHNTMDQMNIDNTIYSKWAHEKVDGYRNDIEMYRPRKDDYILYHYSGKSHIIDQVLAFNLTTILRYHNITPPEFFQASNPDLAQRCREGIEQIKGYIHLFDFFCGDSSYNIENLVQMGADKEKTCVLPISLNLERLQKLRNKNEAIEDMNGHFNILSVGRIAPNKKIEDILDVFENYNKYYQPDSYLYLVGSSEQSDVYTRIIFDRLEKMTAKDHVVMTGKVDDETLYRYYTGANVYLCLSEHEGFCIPLLEAMMFDLPVIAYEAGAVSSTMGESGILIREKKIDLISGIIDELQKDPYLTSRVIDSQHEHLQDFFAPAMQEKLASLLSIWTEKQFKLS